MLRRACGFVELRQGKTLREREKEREREREKEVERCSGGSEMLRRERVE